MSSDIKSILVEMTKKYGDKAMAFGNNMTEEEPDRVSTGSLFLDKCLGTNAKGQSGWPRGRIIELFGPQMSGKSSLAMKTMGEVQKEGGSAAYFDAEKSFESKRAEQLGVDTSKLFVSQEGVGERALQMVCDLIQNGVDMIIVDSVASLVPLSEIEKDLEDGSRMASQAQMMSMAMRKLTNFLRPSTVLIFINQLREKPGTAYGNPEYTPGGKALGFYAGVRVELRKSEPIFSSTNKKKMVGQVTKFKVTKNKTSMPNQDGSFRFMYSGDIDQVDEIISLALLGGQIKQKGAYFYLGDDGFKGREDLEAKIRSDLSLFSKLKEGVLSVQGTT